MIILLLSLCLVVPNLLAMEYAAVAQKDGELSSQFLVLTYLYKKKLMIIGIYI